MRGIETSCNAGAGQRRRATCALQIRSRIASAPAARQQLQTPFDTLAGTPAENAQRPGRQTDERSHTSQRQRNRCPAREGCRCRT